MVGKIIVIVVTLLLVVFLRFGALFLLLAMLPSIIAWFIDQTPKRQVFHTIFAANLAGALSPMIPMINGLIRYGDYDISPIMNNSSVWLMVYASALAGWILIFICQAVARVLVAMMYSYRATMLEDQQERLLKEWGSDIKD